MTTILSDAGLQFASGNIVDLRTTMPSTGNYTAGDIVLESTTTGTRVSGWKRLTTGSAHVLGTDWVLFSGGLTQMATLTPTGTSASFTGIPSWAKRITVFWAGLSTNGTSDMFCRIGSGAYDATGYLGSVQITANASVGGNLYTTGFQVATSTSVAAVNVVHGSLVLFNLPGTNTWVASGMSGRSDTAAVYYFSGSKSLSGALTQIQLTMANGTDVFDAGSVSVTYEG